MTTTQKNPKPHMYVHIARAAGYTVTTQTAIKRGYNDLKLLSLTDQKTRTGHPAIRVTAHATRTPRTWQINDLYRLRDLIAYAAETGEIPLTLIAINTKQGTPSIVMGADMALRAAVRDTETALTRTADNAHADLTQLRADFPEYLAS